MAHRLDVSVGMYDGQAISELLRKKMQSSWSELVK